MATKAQLLGIMNTELADQQPILARQHRVQVTSMLDELYNAQSRGNVLAGLPLTSLQLANDTFLAFRNGAALQIPFSSIFDDPLTLGTPNGLELDETVLSLGLASANTTGALSDADFNIFSAKQDEADKGQPNGYAQLDSGAKIPISLIPDSVLGQVEYEGTWNATTNTPTLPNTPDKKGEYYVVSTAGTFVGIDFQVGDWIISNGVEWEKVNNTDAVRTVFGRLGDVVANANDYASFYVTLDTFQTITGVKIFAGSSLVIASGGGSNLSTRFFNVGGTSGAVGGSNAIGFNGSNNLFLNKGGSTNNGVILSFENTQLRTYTLQDASGTLAFTSDIPSLAGFVTLNTAQNIIAPKGFIHSGSGNSVIINHTSGSGIALDILKAGNGEGLRVAKSSGSGNAVTITGGLLSAEAVTLTGALNGTSAVFSSSVTATSFELGNGQFFRARRNSGNAIINVLGFESGTDDLIQVFSNSWKLRGTGGVGDEKIIVNSAGNVGIGTTAPSFKLDTTGTIRSSGANPSFRTDNTTSYTSLVSHLGGTRSWQIDNRNNDLGVFIGGTSNSYVFNITSAGNVGIGTDSPATSALLDLSSTTGALLLPRMTTTQRDALTAVNGMLIYNTTTDKTEARQGGAWIDLSFFIA